MVISVNWLKKFVDINLEIDKLVELIGSRLVEVEQVIDYGKKYNDCRIVKVESANELEDSDHLRLVKINDGNQTPDIERDENGNIQVVCGAPNIEAGQLVVWLPPNSTVPATFDSPKPIIITSKELRGTKSAGMIASGKELDISDDHQGIMVVDIEVEPGTLFKTAYELDDYLLDIENKSLTHRPDTFGIVGFAREVAAITGMQFKTPDWILEPKVELTDNMDIDLSAQIDEPELSPRYQLAVVSGANEEASSPILVQSYLSRVGMRPINAIVDITNYLMLLTGQPLHAFDYDKLIAVNDGKCDVHVRLAHDDETIKLLDSKEIKLDRSDIVITNGDKAVALAGVMGGIETSIDSKTQNIIIESASFNLYNLRATQMRHGIFSEAVTRFTKGVPAGMTEPTLSKTIQLMNEWTQAKLISDITDVKSKELEPIEIRIEVGKVNAVLGTELDNREIVDILSRAEFEVSLEGDSLTVKVPFWRNDIHIDEDIIEEVGRIYGYDNITPTLARRAFLASRQTKYDNFRDRIRKILVRSGANEVLTYSFIHGDILSKAIQDKSKSYRIINSMSPDLQYYRQSISPSLLSLVHPNIKQGFDEFAIFEINKTNYKDYGLNEEGVPVETDMVALTIAKKKSDANSAYYLAKHHLDYLFKVLNIRVSYQLIGSSMAPISAPFDSNRSAVIIDDGGNHLGVVGEYKKSVIRGFKLPDYTSGFELNIHKIYEAIDEASIYQPLSRYPSIERDVCFKVPEDMSYSQLTDRLQSGLNKSELLIDFRPLDIYQADGSETKNITFHLNLTAMDHTLTNDEVNQVLKPILDEIISELDIQII